MQNDLPGGSSDNDNNFVLETHGEPEEVNVEGSRLAEVADVQDQAVELVNFHVLDPTESDLSVCPRSPDMY